MNIRSVANTNPLRDVVTGYVDQWTQNGQSDPGPANVARHIPPHSPPLALTGFAPIANVKKDRACLRWHLSNVLCAAHSSLRRKVKPEIIKSDFDQSDKFMSGSF